VSCLWTCDSDYHGGLVGVLSLCGFVNAFCYLWVVGVFKYLLLLIRFVGFLCCFYVSMCAGFVMWALCVAALGVCRLCVLVW